MNLNGQNCGFHPQNSTSWGYRTNVWQPPFLHMVSALELPFRQIKFTENTAFSRIIACFPIYKPKNRFHQDRRGGSKGEDHALHFRLGNAAVLLLAVLSFYRLREADSVIFISWKKENRVGVFSATKFLFAHEQRMPEKRSVVNWHLFNLWYNYRQNIFAVRENNAFRIKER